MEEDFDIIGQFGVGFYSAFYGGWQGWSETKPFDADQACLWVSEGADGYTIEPGTAKPMVQNHPPSQRKCIKDNTYLLIWNPIAFVT